MEFYEEPPKRLLPARQGTGGVLAAVTAARQGARTVLIENKGDVGGIVVEG